MKPFYITTSIAYPNAQPHIGYALELVQADFLARYARLSGQKTFFLTGVDEHGLKIQKNALAAGQEPKVFVNEMSLVFEKLAKELGLSNDRFIRTTDADHELMAQALWKACEAKGDIYKKQYQAWYDIKEEEFLGTLEEFPDASAFGIDPQYIELIDEENYFFRLSRYGEEIEKTFAEGRYRVTPANRWLEVLNQVRKTGWQDISISRVKSKLSWGVSVPGDETQVMYVWFDALTNYLTAVSTIDGQGFIVPGEQWPANVHCVGKDIHRFHTIIWAGMLLSAGIELPEELIVHGFINMSGQKMSKSIGNVALALPTLEEYGQDIVRWYLIKDVPTTDDVNFSYERLSQIAQADLSNDFGNLISRVWTMCQKYSGGMVPNIRLEQVDNLERVIVEEKWTEYMGAVAQRELHSAAQAAHNLMVFCNKRIDEMKPWAMSKDSTQTESLQELLYEMLEIVRHISLMLKPIMPLAISRIESELFPHTDPEIWLSFEKGKSWGLLSPGSRLGSEQLILFPRKEK